MRPTEKWKVPPKKRRCYGPYIVFIAKTADKKNWFLFHSLKFLSFKVARYFYESTI